MNWLKQSFPHANKQSDGFQCFPIAVQIISLLWVPRWGAQGGGPPPALLPAHLLHEDTVTFSYSNALRSPFYLKCRPHVHFSPVKFILIKN